MDKFVHAREFPASRGRGNSRAGRAGRRGGWRTALAVGVGLALVTAAGCSTSARPVGGAGSQGSGNSEGVLGPAGANHASDHGKAGKGAAGGSAAAANGVLFGGDIKFAAVQGALGRKLAIVRVYDVIGERFLTPTLASLMSQGTTVLVSLDTYPGSGPSYASIAAGQHDSTIMAWLKSVEQAAVTYHLPAVYVTFEHEADNISKHQGLGTPAQFVQAWDHIHALAVSAHLDWNQGGRIHWAMILMHFAYLNGSAAAYWPGTGEADIVAADGYNTGGCRQARHTGGGFTFGRTPAVSPASLFSKVVSFAAARGHVPVFIAEWGSVPYSSPSVRVSFIQQMQSFVQANPEIAGVLYWNSAVPPCNYTVNNSPTSLAALATMGRVFQGQLVG
jgi:hypothetical protein